MAGIKLRGFCRQTPEQEGGYPPVYQEELLHHLDNNRKGLVPNRKRIIDGLDAYRRVFGCKRPSGFFITNIEKRCAKPDRSDNS